MMKHPSFPGNATSNGSGLTMLEGPGESLLVCHARRNLSAMNNAVVIRKGSVQLQPIADHPRPTLQVYNCFYWLWASSPEGVELLPWPKIQENLAKTIKDNFLAKLVADQAC